MLAVLLPAGRLRVPITFVVVLLALAGTGALGARLGGGGVGRATVRVVIGGTIALATTFAIGRLLGTSGLV